MSDKVFRKKQVNRIKKSIDSRWLVCANPTAKENRGDYILNAFVSEKHLLIG